MVAKLKIWDCKIGEVDAEKLPHGADLPMRQAVRKGYKELTGEEPLFIFSGWGGKLDEGERAVVENREPRIESETTEIRCPHCKEQIKIDRIKIDKKIGEGVEGE
jgi:hypothetical protein